MTRGNLRVALTVLSVGFALEGLGELYTLLTPGSTRVGPGLLFVLPGVLAVVGLGLMWAARREWTDIQWSSARAASHVFLASVTGGIAAAGVIAVLLYDPALGVPWWAPLLFGAAIAGFVWGTTVTYAYLLYDLLSGPTRGLLTVGMAWALLVAAIAGTELAGNLPTVLELVSQRRLTIPAFIAPVDATLAWLFVSFFALLVASIQAQVSVARGRLRAQRKSVRRPSALRPVTGSYAAQLTGAPQAERPYYRPRVPM